MKKITLWKKEFYPVGASTLARKKDVTALELVEHSIRKWEGLQDKQTSKAGLTINDTEMYDRKDPDYSRFKIDRSSCALCQKYEGARNDCSRCPLAQARRGVNCWTRKITEQQSPWEAFLNGDPAPMLASLKKVRTELAAKEVEHEVLAAAPSPVAEPVRAPLFKPWKLLELQVVTGNGMAARVAQLLAWEVERAPDRDIIVVHTSKAMACEWERALPIFNPILSKVRHVTTQAAIKMRYALGGWDDELLVMHDGDIDVVAGAGAFYWNLKYV